MDASYRYDDRSIHLSYISRDPLSPQVRSLPFGCRRHTPASVHILDAFPDFLPHRAKGTETTPMALVASADSGRPFRFTRLRCLAPYIRIPA